jgi:uncharacterized iron-regulated membrane protein
MRALWPGVNRWLTWFHRWAGVVLSLLFALWFASGAVLHFVGFPSLSATDRFAHSETIDLARLEVAPAAALARAEAVAGMRPVDGVRLVSVAGTPTYIVSVAGTPKSLMSSGESEIAVAGDTGQVTRRFSAATAGIVATRFGDAAVAGIAGPLDYDQWIVHQQFDPYRPLFRVRLDDPERTDLYVSARTGEVVQRTTERERFWNWCGAVLHWIYFTPVRKDWSLWNQLVWWISLVALLTSVVGTWLGLHRYLKNRASGKAGLSPYRGWMRWHHVIGLFASIVVLGWIFSGWLSMDHGRFFSLPGASAAESARMRGMSFAAITEATPLDVLRSVGPASIIELHAVDGRPLLTIRGGKAGGSRILWLDTREVSEAPIPRALLLSALKAAWLSDAVTPIVGSSSTDEMYRQAESVPEDAMAARTGSGGRIRVYVGQFSGLLLAVMNPSRRAYAWVYFCLHTLNFPGLVDHPAARTIVEMLLLLLGFGSCVTGIVLGVRRLKIELS